MPSPGKRLRGRVRLSGLPRREPLPEEKVTPGRRILFLGDSNTFGIRVPLEKTFALQLETLLPGTRSLNLGVPGYSSLQGKQLLARHLAALDPEVVVIAFHYNDRRYVTPGSSADDPA